MVMDKKMRKKMKKAHKKMHKHHKHGKVSALQSLARKRCPYRGTRLAGVGEGDCQSEDIEQPLCCSGRWFFIKILLVRI